MTEQPLVSIVIPSYNAATYLREAVDSLLAQTYTNLEILVVDDASSDDTPRIAAEYGNRIRYVRYETNLGIYENVNRGIALARGEFIATYHADDIYLPEIVERQVAYLRSHSDVGAVFCSDIFVDAQGQEYGRLTLPGDVRGERPLDYRSVLNAMLTYKNRFLVCPTAMVRAAVYRDLGPYRQAQYRNTADLEMWLRIARRYPIAVLETHLMKYRHFHGNSSQRYHWLRTAPENFFRIVDEYLANGSGVLATRRALTSYEAHRSEDRLMAAINHYIKGEPTDARRALRDVRIGPVLRSPHVQRWRLLALTAGMWGLVRLPRLETVAHAMHARRQLHASRTRAA